MLSILSSLDLARMVPHNTLYWAGKEIHVRIQYAYKFLRDLNFAVTLSFIDLNCVLKQL